MVSKASLLALCATAALATANSAVQRRAVDQLNDEATREAHQRDDTATRAFSDVQIKTSDGRCLTVDELSGDFRANLTPVQIAECASGGAAAAAGQGWDIITSGKHNDRQGQMLVVSTLTQACLNFDPRRQAGSQLLLFSCGGRADGGGEVTDSQLFAFGGGAGPLSLTPFNVEGVCATGAGEVLDVATCVDGAQDQVFTLGDGESDAAGAAGVVVGKRGGGRWGGRGGRGNRWRWGGHRGGHNNGGGQGRPQYPAPSGGQGAPPVTPGASSIAVETTTAAPSETEAAETETTETDLRPVATSSAEATATTTENPATPTKAPGGGGNNNNNNNGGGNNNNGGALPTINPTDPVPVSRAGGTLNPTAAAEAHQFDPTAKRTKASVNIRAADGRCLSVDPTAGDFRQNLIPVAMLECADVASQKFDIVNEGRHNNGRDGSVLLVSVLTEGCISFDPRRDEGDKVTVFSCGGRADGGGETDSAQLYPYDGSETIILQPQSGRGASCLIAGDERLDATNCNQGDDQKWEVVEVL